ncbi:hypothetical protein GmHk_20G057735 [Glycine max]|nr:hypothetical protein GmHk_20G057735 [Glycine max]
MQVSMSNQKSTESAIKNLEVQVGQLAKQLAKRSSNSFIANTEKNPKEKCKAVMTTSKIKHRKKVEGSKQQLADELALEPVDDLVELEEIVEEAEDDEEGETPIRDCQEKMKKKEEKEEEIKKEEEKEKKLKNEKQKEKVVETEKKKGKSEANIVKKKEATPIESKEVPYPLLGYLACSD